MKYWRCYYYATCAQRTYYEYNRHTYNIFYVFPDSAVHTTDALESDAPTPPKKQLRVTFGNVYTFLISKDESSEGSSLSDDLSLALEYNHENVLMDLGAMEDMEGGWWFPLQASPAFLTWTVV